MKKLVSLAALGALAAAALTPVASYADDGIAYNIGAVSDYRVRGIAQTSFGPALQGGIDFTKGGLYVGTFLSNVKWIKDFNGATKGDVEVDLYGGYRGSITKDLNYDAGVITYQYPGNNSGDAGTPGAGLYSNASTWEAYLHLSYNIVNFNYNRSIGDFLGNKNSSGSQYFDLNATFDLGNGFSLTPHVGHQKIPGQNGLADYTDYSLALGKDFGGGFSGTLTALGTNTKKPGFYTDLKGHDLGKSTATVAVKYTF